MKAGEKHADPGPHVMALSLPSCPGVSLYSTLHSTFTLVRSLLITLGLTRDSVDRSSQCMADLNPSLNLDT